MKRKGMSITQAGIPRDQEQRDNFMLYSCYSQ